MAVNEMIGKYAKYNGAVQVWRSWRDTMLWQGRDVKPKYMKLSTLPDKDIRLDAQIAADVIVDFLVWVETHYGYRLRGGCDE